MSFTIKCSKCNAASTAEDEWRGQEAECPVCGAMIIIKKAEIGYGFSIRKTPLPKTGNMMKADTALPSDEQKTCPKCQKPISSPNAVICIECGFELKTGRKISAAALTETPQPFPMSKMPPKVKSCPGCQHPLSDNAVLCVQCGYNRSTGQKILGADANQESTAKKSTTAKKTTMATF